MNEPSSVFLLIVHESHVGSTIQGVFLSKQEADDVATQLNKESLESYLRLARTFNRSHEELVQEWEECYKTVVEEWKPGVIKNKMLWEFKNGNI